MKSSVDAMKKNDVSLYRFQLSDTKFELLKNFEILNRDLIREIKAVIKMPTLSIEPSVSEFTQLKKNRVDSDMITKKSLRADYKCFLGIYFDKPCFEVEQRKKLLTFRMVDFSGSKAPELVASQNFAHILVESVFF